MNTLQQQHLEDDSDSSQHGRRKNNQNTFSWSSTSSHSTLLSHLNEEDTATTTTTTQNDILLNDFNDLPNDKKSQKASEIICRLSSLGDLDSLVQFMNDARTSSYLNLDLPDDTDGSTPLIYASCFGKLNVVTYLLQYGVNVNIQDKIGWTALMWATTNGHDQIVQLLLDYSASSDTKSKSGRTIFDLVDVDNEKMISILSPTTRKNPYWKNIDTTTNLPKPSDKSSVSQQLKSCEASFRSVHKFSWDQCLPDQMFVFAEQDIDHILDVAISDLKLPMKWRSEIYVPANIIFLCSRFAHYYTCRELVHQLLSKAVQRIETVVKSNTHDIHILSFWIANLSQLLYYLKKDVGLVVATAEYQLEISELISETYTFLVQDSEKRMNRILEPAMVEFEQFALDAIEFQDDWQRFFRRSRFTSNARRSIPDVSPPPQQFIQSSLSPQSLTSLLSSILYVLQSYDVHPVIVIQAMAQLFHFLSCEIFNRILSNKKYLCRSKALQIRMNLTVIEEWVREHHLPTTLSAYFNPVIQLVQLLQCVSQLQDLMDFVSTTKSFDLLNAVQIKRLVLNYRYEVLETRLPEEIEKYTMQIAQDTMKSMQMEQDHVRKSSIDSSIQLSPPPPPPPAKETRPNSISSLGSLLQSISASSNKKQNSRLSIQSLDMIEDENESDFLLQEKRDSKYMLPFSLPTTTNMVHSGWNQSIPNEIVTENQETSLSDKIYNELKLKSSAEREKNARERSIIPTIPEEWLQLLDQHPIHNEED